MTYYNNLLNQIKKINVNFSYCCILILAGFTVGNLNAQTGDIPTGLPQAFELGYKYDGQTAVVNWHTEVNIPFGYGYRYLSGGANTTSNWKTWLSPSGQSLRTFINATLAANLIPVVTYYNHLNSLPSEGTHEIDRVINNLRNNTTMLAIYEDIQLVLEICSEFNDKIILHVEPDLFGFIEKSARADNVSLSNFQASVASSGYSQAQNLPNTAVGYALTLLKMRDTYASNVLMAIPFSNWANKGITNNNNVLTEATIRQRAEETGQFFSEMGLTPNTTHNISAWDLFFFDTNGRDAAYRELVSNEPVNSAWWTNTELDNLRTWADQLNITTGLRSMYWQIALGNQKYKTIDNTTGHYEDLITEYLLDDISSNRLTNWAESGVIALLFGSGNANTTNNFDYQNDGITNGNTSGLTSTVSDDDGGYFRYKSSQYYTNGKIDLSPSLGVNDNESSIISWFPNPIKETLTVSNLLFKKNDVTIYNLLGQNFTKDILISGNNINISKLPKGFYVVKIKTFTNKIYKK